MSNYEITPFSWHSPKFHCEDQPSNAMREAEVAKLLQNAGIEFFTQEDLYKQHAPKTPDFLLKKPVLMDGVEIRWIEVKKAAHTTENGAQTASYKEIFGSGIKVIFEGENEQLLNVLVSDKCLRMSIWLFSALLRSAVKTDSVCMEQISGKTFMVGDALTFGTLGQADDRLVLLKLGEGSVRKTLVAKSSDIEYHHQLGVLVLRNPEDVVSSVSFKGCKLVSVKEKFILSLNVCEEICLAPAQNYKQIVEKKPIPEKEVTFKVNLSSPSEPPAPKKVEKIVRISRNRCEYKFKRDKKLSLEELKSLPDNVLVCLVFKSEPRDYVSNRVVAAKLNIQFTTTIVRIEARNAFCTASLGMYKRRFSEIHSIHTCTQVV